MYVPNDVSVYTAAYAGAIAGMGVSDRVPTSSNYPDYAGLASVVGAFAEAFDTSYVGYPVDGLTLAAIQEVCESAWQSRAPLPVPPQLSASTYASLCAALTAIVAASEVYFNAEGIVPPSPGGPPGPPGPPGAAGPPGPAGPAGTPNVTRSVLVLGPQSIPDDGAVHVLAVGLSHTSLTGKVSVSYNLIGSFVPPFTAGRVGEVSFQILANGVPLPSRASIGWAIDGTGTLVAPSQAAFVGIAFNNAAGLGAVVYTARITLVGSGIPTGFSLDATNAIVIVQDILP